jgi:ubiquinol-cytochrome c reductase iron-sulfur subunit
VTRRLILGSLATATIAGFALSVAYFATHSNEALGTLLAICLAGIGVAVVAWALTLEGHDVEEERHPFVADGSEAEVTAPIEPSPDTPTRRTFLGMLGAAGAALLAALLVPFRSLDPGPGPQLRHTKWTPGARLVDITGAPVRSGAVDVDSVMTVFPEGFAGDGSSQALLIRVDPGSFTPQPGREDWSPGGHLVYSKVCTHAGCPVGLYEAADRLLLCPCHQSTFQVLDAARPIFGPAPRPLPQLPVAVGDNGWLVAQSDFTEPVGPGFWDRNRR